MPRPWLSLLESWSNQCVINNGENAESKASVGGKGWSTKWFGPEVLYKGQLEAPCRRVPLCQPPVER